MTATRDKGHAHMFCFGAALTIVDSADGSVARMFAPETSLGIMASRDPPAVIDSSPSTRAHARVGSPDLLWALAAAMLAAILYIATLQPDLGGPEDTPKFQFLGYVFGTAHPPGYPLYSMLSGVFVRLAPIGSIAYRANLFSALMAAFSCGTAFMIGRFLGASRWTAACAALGLASGASFWRSAVFAEVYSLAAAAAGVSLALLLAWGERLRPIWLLGAIAATAAAFGNHLTIVGVVPAYVIYVLVRDRRVLTVRVVALAALIVTLGFAQYGFILLRTKQRALYLESRANSVRELVAIVTAERFAEQRFAYSLSTLLTVQLPVVTETMEADLRPGGLLLVLAGIIGAVWVRRAGALVTLGAGLGMLWMIVNLGGDVKGFITPLMVFVWPFAAVGADAVCRIVSSLIRLPAAGVIAGGLAAASLPIVNVAANYKEADQSRMRENAEFFKELHRQLPDEAGVVTEDYFYDMSLHYFRATGEAPEGKRLQPVPFDAGLVRAAALGTMPGDPAPRPRPVFAFAGAATYFAVEGLRFVPIHVDGLPLEEWLRRLPAGSVLVAATAYLPGPLDFTELGHPNARPPGRAQNFETFAMVVKRPGERWTKHYSESTLVVDSPTLNATLPAFGGTLRAIADERSARVELGERAIVSTPSGIALAVFWADGTLMRAIELADHGPWNVPFNASVYELKGETPCLRVTRGWTDISPVLTTGSAVATLLRTGTAVLETALEERAPIHARTSGPHGDALTRDLGLTREPDGTQLWRSELTRTGGRRTVFRFTLDRTGVRARARFLSHQEGSIVLCSLPPLPLFRSGRSVDLIRPNFENESYFGAGWSGVELAGTGRIRLGDDHATLLLPLENGYAYRVTVDLTGPADSQTFVDVNGVAAGACRTADVASCSVDVRPAAGAGPVSTLTLMTRAADGAPIAPRSLIFRGARIERFTSAVTAAPPNR